MPTKISTQTTISPAFQTTLAAEAVRALKLRPGMRLSQTVEGRRIILEPLDGVDALAGSLGRGRRPVSVAQMNQGARDAIGRASRKSLRADPYSPDVGAGAPARRIGGHPVPSPESRA